MCYSIPGRVVGMEDGVAVIDYFGEKKRALVFDVKPAIGDHVYAQAGLVVQKLDAEKAESVLRAWKTVFAELRQKDLSLAAEPPATGDARFDSIIERALGGEEISRAEAIHLMETGDGKKLSSLYQAANAVRAARLKNSCCVHAVIEFSNACSSDCSYCGIRKSNKALPRYRMTIEEIVSAADHAVNRLGFKALVLQSGEDPWFTPDRLTEVVQRVKEKCPAVIFVSVGEAGEEAYEEMWDAGARGALIRFETSNPQLYSRLHEGQELKERLDCIRRASKLGYLVATGGLVGLPGQTREDLVNDIFLSKELGAEVFSFGPFIPHPQTPLASEPEPGLDSVLKVLAVGRLVAQDAKILVTTALETLDPEGKRKGLLAGAGSLMLNATPAHYQEKYAIYPGKPRPDVKKAIAETVSLLHSLGRAPTDFEYS